MKLLICIFALLVAVPRHATSAEAQQITLSVAGVGRPLTLLISSPGGSNFLLKRSVDLKTWLPFITVYSRVDHFRLVDRSEFDPLSRTTFLTASSSVHTPEEMLDLWRAQGFAAYRFTYRRICFCAPRIVVEAVVTVRDGKVVGVENAKDASGSPVANPDLSAVKSVEELYAIAATERARADVVQIGVDPDLDYPTWIDIDPKELYIDDEVTYQISDLVRIE